MDLPGDLFEAGDFLASVVARINALFCEASIFQGPVWRFVEGHDIRTTKTEVGSQWLAFAVALTLNCDTNDPAPGTGWIDYKVQTAAVAVATGAEGSHQILCQLSAQSSHKVPRFLPRNE